MVIFITEISVWWQGWLSGHVRRPIAVTVPSDFEPAGKLLQAADVPMPRVHGTEDAAARTETH